MQIELNNCRLELMQGDITRQSVDAIVNAANSELAGGGGVDGAIHEAAGASIMQETKRRYPDGCRTGEAVVTAAGNLSAKFIFHTVGPIWQGGFQDETRQLRSAIRNCLELTIKHNCKSIALPAVSTGVYQYPMDLAATDSLEVARDFILEYSHLEILRFVLFSEGAYGAFCRVLELMINEP